MQAASEQQVDPLFGVSPWLRWAGGKRTLSAKLSAEICAVRPRFYIEPFLGGGAIALSLPSALPKILGDVNPQLIDCWLCMQRNSGELYRELDAAVELYGNGKAGYVKARQKFNEMIGNPRKMWAQRSALLMYLNARCFNGLWRTNAYGYFNVPFGQLEKPRAFHWNDFIPYVKALKTATIVADHYALTIGREMNKRLEPILKRGDLAAATLAMNDVAIYADPPYDGTFAGYAKGGFTDHDQEVLATLLGSAAAAGAAVWATNSDTPKVREWYSWAQIEEVNEHHSVGATGDRRGKRGCLLIRGGQAIRGS